MAQPRYDIYFTGHLVEGRSKEQAIQAFATLFKMPSEKAARLFTGEAQLIKRGAEKDEAIRYKAALHKAGMMCAFKPHQASAPATAPISPTQTTPKPNNPSVQAVAVDRSKLSTAPQSSPATNDSQSHGLTLAPSGSDLLRTHERQNVAPVAIDTSGISLVSAFSQQPSNKKEAAPLAPDTSHISMADVGSDLLEGHHQEFVAVELDLSSISLAPAGTDLEQIKLEHPSINPDISQLSLAAAGADLREGQPKKPAIQAPDTGHLALLSDG